MDSRKKILKDTGCLLLGEVAGAALMVVVFAAFSAFSLAVIVSSLIGCVVITANYFAMAVGLSIAADRAEAGDVKKAQQMAQLSSTVRLVVMGVILLTAIKLGANVIALLLPLLFMRPVLMVLDFFRKKVD